MTTFAIYIYGEINGEELTDVEYYDSYECMDQYLQLLNIHTAEIAGERNMEDNWSVSWGAVPGGAETSYDVYCFACKSLMWKGIDSE